jgi:hypothetical protein
VRWLVVITLLVGASCGEATDGVHCTPPDATTYACEPIPAGTYGCVGGPTWMSHRTGEVHHDDPDLTFPVGCRAEVPECGCCYPTGRTFSCEGRFPEPNDAGVDAASEGPAGWGELL